MDYKGQVMRNNLDSLAARDQHSKSALAAQSGIYLRGLPEQITEDTLRAIFSTHAPVVNVEIMSCLDHGKKVAFVNLSNEAAAEQVLAAYPEKIINIQGVPVNILPKRHSDSSSSTTTHNQPQQQQPIMSMQPSSSNSKVSSRTSSAHPSRASSPFTAAAGAEAVQDSSGWAAAVASLGAAARAAGAAAAMPPVQASTPVAPQSTANTAAAAAAQLSNALSLSPPPKHPEYQAPDFVAPASAPAPAVATVAVNSSATAGSNQLFSHIQARRPAVAVGADAAPGSSSTTAGSRPLPRPPPGFPPLPSYPLPFGTEARPAEGFVQHFRPIPLHFQQQQQHQPPPPQQPYPQAPLSHLPPPPAAQPALPGPTAAAAAAAAAAAGGGVPLPAPHGSSYHNAAAPLPALPPPFPVARYSLGHPPQFIPSGLQTVPYGPGVPLNYTPAPPPSPAALDAARIITDLEHLRRAYHTLSHCLLCGAAPRSVVLMPCKHLALCEGCSTQMQADAAGAVETDESQGLRELGQEKPRSSWEEPDTAGNAPAAAGLAEGGFVRGHKGLRKVCQSKCPLCGAAVKSHIGEVKLPGI